MNGGGTKRMNGYGKMNARRSLIAGLCVAALGLTGAASAQAAETDQAVIDKINASATFNQGFATTEYLASALIDMRYHMTDPTGIDPDAFEREELAKLNMPSELVMRHRSPHFLHIFSSEGYATGYYGYMWADVLTSDASEAFEEALGAATTFSGAARLTLDALGAGHLGTFVETSLSAESVFAPDRVQAVLPFHLRVR